MNQPLAGYAPTPVAARMENHGANMLKVAMQTGNDLLARVGSMVAYEGFVQYEPNPPAVRQIARDWITGEGAPLMKATGDGILYLADYGAEIVVINLGGESISVNGTNLLAFDAHLQWASSASRASPSSPARACGTSRSPGRAMSPSRPGAPPSSSTAAAARTRRTSTRTR